MKKWEYCGPTISDGMVQAFALVIEVVQNRVLGPSPLGRFNTLTPPPLMRLCLFWPLRQTKSSFDLGCPVHVNKCIFSYM